MPASLKQSYQHCRRLARERARNFYYGFWLLPQPRRDAFCAVYAFMRYCDDVADGETSPEEKAVRLHEWHRAVDRAFAGDYGDDLILPAFHDAARRYEIPTEYFHELIGGAEMDLTIHSYRTFDELYQYCYRVASVVGLCSLHMFGFRDSKAKLLAERCGIAFQLTNILRDINEDAAAGRIYLPLEDLERFGYPPEQLVAGVQNHSYRELMRHEIRRARDYYDEAAPLIAMVEPESRPALWTLISIYRGVLRVIETRVEQRAERDGETSPVLSPAGSDQKSQDRPAGLTGFEKIVLVLRASYMRLQLRAGGKPDWRLLA